MVDKTQHKPIIPEFKRIGKWVMKFKVPSLLIVFALIIPAFLAQSEIDFIYGIGDQPENTRAGADIAEIEQEFGKNTQMVLLVPKGEVAKEEQLVHELEDMKHVTSVLAYVNTVDPAIPPEYLEESQVEQFYSENYSRIILQTNTDKEGETAFNVVEQIQDKANQYYAEDRVYSLGESVTLYDMKNVVERDNTVVNVLTVVTIALVLLISFKSISYPVILLLTIQSAVWINLAVP